MTRGMIPQALKFPKFSPDHETRSVKMSTTTSKSTYEMLGIPEEMCCAQRRVPMSKASW